MPCVAEVVNRSLKADCTDYTLPDKVLLDWEGFFNLALTRKSCNFFLASVSKKRIVFFGAFRSCKDGKILLNGVIKLLRLGRLE